MGAIGSGKKTVLRNQLNCHSNTKITETKYRLCLFAKIRLQIWHGYPVGRMRITAIYIVLTSPKHDHFYDVKKVKFYFIDTLYSKYHVTLSGWSYRRWYADHNFQLLIILKLSEAGYIYTIVSCHQLKWEAMASLYLCKFQSKRCVSNYCSDCSAKSELHILAMLRDPTRISEL